MPTTDPLQPYVNAWSLAWNQGRDPTPAELCPDHPEWHEALRERIAPLRRDETPPNSDTLINMPSVSDSLILAGSEATNTDPAPPVASIEYSSAWIPQQLGDYRILGVLGRGGMGVVLRAEDTKLLRQVAIKLVLPELLANPTARERFVREARSQANIHHDNIAQIFHISEHAGMTFIVMPLLHGESLKSRLEREPVPPMAFTLRVARDTAEGLAAAHANGVIHRDIKPANIWLEGDLAADEESDRFRRAKILDFGLARVSGALTAKVSTTGELLGTPAYMSPEQVTDENIDHRTDLFSLGTMLYEMATGKHPFEGSNAFATLGNLTSHHPDPARSLNPAIPPGFSDLIGRLLAKSPDHRPATAREVVEAVRRLAAGFSEPFAVSPVPTPKAPPPSHPNIRLDVPPPEPFSDEESDPPRPIGLSPTRFDVPAPTPPATPVTPVAPVPSAKSWKDTAQVTTGSPKWLLPGVLAVSLVLVAGLAFLIVRSRAEPDVAATNSTEGTLTTPTNDSANTTSPTTRITQPTTMTTPTRSDPTIPPKTQTQPVPLPETYTDQIGIKLQLIPAGTFTMGLKNTDSPLLQDQPSHEVEITRPFYIGRTEVTRGQFRKFVEEMKYVTDAEKSRDGGYGLLPGSKTWFGRDPKFSWRDVGFEQTDDHPVLNVSWNDAVAFCEWRSRKENRSYRLPTEAEWEYVQRGRDGTPKFDERASLGRVANVADEATKKKFERDNEGKTTKTFPGNDGYPFTAAVGSFQANGFGVEDLTGNAAEWCRDFAGDWNGLPNKDPVQIEVDPDARHVVRGGSFSSGSPILLQARFQFPANTFLHEIGFRVCVDPPQK